MEKSTEYKYIIFPLPLLQEIFKKPERGFSDLLYVGVYCSALTQKIEPENAFKQAIYCYYRQGLTTSLKERFDELEENGVLSADTFYRGFDSDGFNPEIEIEELMKLNDPGLMEEIREFYMLYQIRAVLKLDFDIRTVIAVYHHYQRKYNSFTGQPRVMITTKMMLDFIHGEKTEFERVLFAAYAAIRSLMGKNKRLLETTHERIFTRMFGAKNAAALALILEDEAVKKVYDTYTTRHQRTKIMEQLVARNFIRSKVWTGRRLYLSTTIPYEKLGLVVDLHRQSRDLRLRVQSNKVKELEAKEFLSQQMKRKKGKNTSTNSGR